MARRSNTRTLATFGLLARTSNLAWGSERGCIASAGIDWSITGTGGGNVRNAGWRRWRLRGDHDGCVRASTRRRRTLGTSILVLAQSRDCSCPRPGCLAINRVLRRTIVVVSAAAEAYGRLKRNPLGNDSATHSHLGRWALTFGGAERPAAHRSTSSLGDRGLHELGPARSHRASGVYSG